LAAGRGSNGGVTGILNRRARGTMAVFEHQIRRKTSKELLVIPIMLLFLTLNDIIQIIYRIRNTTILVRHINTPYERLKSIRMKLPQFGFDYFIIRDLQ